ncbi:hypothetical protein [Streptomyces sp. NPDC089919]|uniref:hypothetical protein n=1 Tax=Streptomyces sp. NPDC089919 TaxID=3155188 RepID=UPI00342B79BC
MGDAERQAAAEAMEAARTASTVAIWNATIAAEDLAATNQAAGAVVAEVAAHLAQ